MKKALQIKDISSASKTSKNGFIRQADELADSWRMKLEKNAKPNENKGLQHFTVGG